MNVFTIIFLIFAILGALDYLFGNKIGLGGEFKRGFKFFSATSLSMIGIIILAPALAVWIKPFFESFYNIFKIDPSIIPASLFANDMGGASLALEVAKNATAFGNMKDMDKKGTVINSAFACSAAYIFGSHLAFTSAMAPKLYRNSYRFKAHFGNSSRGACPYYNVKKEERNGLTTKIAHQIGGQFYLFLRFLNTKIKRKCNSRKRKQKHERSGVSAA